MTDTMHRHAETWMKRRVGDDEFVTDVTGGCGQLNVQDRRSRELLESLTNSNLL